ncbi:hypothetical protein [Paenibacillus sp. 2TAB19]|uniref:hypothetical protein n=1 Tax=Paenibacillus sp. 2TAB19 TaxID=3233003 RepID=UPI003F97B9DF
MSDKEEGQQQAAPREKKSTPKQKVAEQLIYVGPTLSGGLLAQYTVFRGGLPANLQKRIEQEPAIGEMIVPVGALASTNNKIKQAGSAEQIAYSSLATK